MMTMLLWADVEKKLPEPNKKCICMTSNGNYLLSEIVQTKTSQRWKGSTKATESITKWAYLDFKNNLPYEE